MNEEEAKEIVVAAAKDENLVSELPTSLQRITPARLAKHSIDIMAEISARNFEPRDGAWGGEEEIIEWVVKELNFAESTARDLVRYAVEELLAPHKKEKGPQRRAAIARHTQIKRMVLSGAARPRREVKYSYEDELDAQGEPTGRQVRKRVSLKEIDPDWCRVASTLLEVERSEAELRGLFTKDEDSGATTAELLEELEEEVTNDGKVVTKRRRKASAAQKIKQGDIAGPAAKAAMERFLDKARSTAPLDPDNIPAIPDNPSNAEENQTTTGDVVDVDVMEA